MMAAIARQGTRGGDLFEPAVDDDGRPAVVALIKRPERARAGPLHGRQGRPLLQEIAPLHGRHVADPVQGLREILLQQAGQAVAQRHALVDQLAPLLAEELQRARLGRVRLPGADLGAVFAQQVQQQRGVCRVILGAAGPKRFPIPRQRLGIDGIEHQKVIRRQVSTGGGTRPLWARNGHELFHLSPTGALMRVGVERGPSWAATTPTPPIKEGYVTVPGGNPGRTYDISPDDQRFLLIKAEQGATPITSSSFSTSMRS